MKSPIRKISAVLMALATTTSITLPAGAAITPKIYYGNVVSAPNPYPWMTALLNPDRPNGYDAQFCGGSLIASDVIITAAHCVEDITAAQVEVAVDVLNLSSITDGDRQTVEEIIIHPDWNTYTTENDIALLVLADGSVNSGITPVKLIADGANLTKGTGVRALGWGEIQDGSYPNALRTVDLEIAANPGAACGSYGGSYDPDSMLCATGLSGRNTKDTCSGDSGGPLFSTAGGTFRLVGLTSWGNDCGLRDYPGIYTRLTSFVNWVYSETSLEATEFDNFTPRSGAPGQQVTITTDLLDSATSIEIGELTASFTTTSPGVFVATVPAGATTGKITISDGIDTYSSWSDFTVAYPTPKPSKVTPSSGTFGTSVTITGTGFLGTTGVNFGGVSASSFTVNSDTSITATVPEGAKSGSIMLVNPSRTGTGAKFTVTVPAGYPTVTKFSKSSANPGDTITLTGTNLLTVTAVSFNGVAAVTFSSLSATQLSVVVPTGATTGLVSVTNNLGTNTSSKSININYATPSISSFSPSSASVGDTVTITGRNLLGVTSVRFNGVAATSFNVVSATSITAVVPAGATSGKVTVANPSKSGSSRSSLTIIG